MKLSYRVLDYLTLTLFVWGLYLIWLIPFQLIWVGMSWDMFVTWIIWGSILEMIFTYPIIKAVAKYAPKITLYWQGLSDNHDKKG